MVISSMYISLCTATVKQDLLTSLAIEHSTEVPTSLDLSLCSMLRDLSLFLGSEAVANEQSLEMIRTMLSSLDAEVPLQYLCLNAYFAVDFTRQAYADVLRTMGQVLKGRLHGSPVPSTADREANEKNTDAKIVIWIPDRVIWIDWWWAQITDCFPTFVESNRTLVICHTRE